MPFVTIRFQSRTNEWATPDSIFCPLNDEFCFTLDVAATFDNRKCNRFFDKMSDGLHQPWSGVCWMNPPFGHGMRQWIKKAYDESKSGNATVVALLPARTNAGYWHDYCMKGEIRFIRGYPKFGNAKQGLKAPMAVVIWRAK